MNGKGNGDMKNARSVEAEVLEALAEFTVGLETGDVFKHMQNSKAKLSASESSIVKRTRTQLGLRETGFARLMGVSSITIKRWERGDEVPPPTAYRFMEEMRLNPEYWIQRSRDLAKRKNGKVISA